MSERTYTKEQETLVLRILQHPNHEYYKILQVEKTATDSEIKKAYRKLSLKVHPDKNPHPKTDEAFKKVAKAFEVLGDTQKRTIYDQTGADPSSRGGMGGGGAGGSSGFAGHGGSPFDGGHPFFQAGGPFGFGGGGPQGFSNFQFQGADGPDLFDILFGNSGMGGPGGATFSFGGPGGVRFASAGGSPFAQRPRQRQRAAPRAQQQQQQQTQQETPDFIATLKNYLPLILILVIPMISNWFSDPPEQFHLNKQAPFTHERSTTRYNVPYYITTKQAKTLPQQKLKKLDREVENTYVSRLQDLCRRENTFKEHQIQNAYGWFFTDTERLEQAQNIQTPNCEKLVELGINLL